MEEGLGGGAGTAVSVFFSFLGWEVGGGGRGRAKVSDLFLQRIQILKKKNIFLL